jgi:Protein of unknown function (DUF3095)
MSDFYDRLPILDDFAEATRASNHAPAPNDWVVGCADVVGSTAAIAQGRYKTVNMVGAGAIAAVANALERRAFPFVFGGDGASLAVSSQDAAPAAQALAAMAAFARAEFELDLRVAMMPVSEIRAAGRDVRVARFAASKHCVYAMFSGGGAAWLTERAKLGEKALPAAKGDARANLAGLSCRWGVAPAKRGVVLSVIVTPRDDDPRFGFLVEEIVDMTLDAARCGPPITAEGLGVGAAEKAIALETMAISASGVPRFTARLKAASNYLVHFASHRFKLKAGGLDAALFADDVVANADFRKFDDGLRMTLDCTLGFADALEERLVAADDYANWGLFRQRAAQLTCFVPSIAERSHVHFVDGADGGYTMAASAMKARRLLKANPA